MESLEEQLLAWPLGAGAGTGRVMHKASHPDLPWPHLQEIIDHVGQLSIGPLNPVRCTARTWLRHVRVSPPRKR